MPRTKNVPTMEGPRVFNIRLDQADLDILKAQAKKRRIPASVYARTILVKEILARETGMESD